MLKVTKINKNWNWVLQGLIFLLTYLFIIRQVFYRDGLLDLKFQLGIKLSETSFLIVLPGIFILMLINWGIETWKWRYLIRKIEEIRFFFAFQAVLTGISISSFIPNRVGEFFGRAFFLKKADPVEGIIISVIGSMSQLIITMVCGSVAFLFFAKMQLGDIPLFQGYLFIAFAVFILIINLIIIGLYLNVSFLALIKEKIILNGFSRLRRYFRVFDFYHTRELGWVLILSLLRYLVFSFQFYLLNMMFGISMPLLHGLMLIAVIYFIMTIIPTVALTELGIRGSVAISVFNLYYSMQPDVATGMASGVFFASTLLWIINLGVPAIAGSFFVFRLRFFRKK